MTLLFTVRRTMQLDYRECVHPECKKTFGVLSNHKQKYCSQVCRYHDDKKFRNDFNKKNNRFHKFKREEFYEKNAKSI